MGVMKW